MWICAQRSWIHCVFSQDLYPRLRRTVCNLNDENLGQTLQFFETKLQLEFVADSSTLRRKFWKIYFFIANYKILWEIRKRTREKQNASNSWEIFYWKQTLKWEVAVSIQHFVKQWTCRNVFVLDHHPSVVWRKKLLLLSKIGEHSISQLDEVLPGRWADPVLISSK